MESLIFIAVVFAFLAGLLIGQASMWRRDEAVHPKRRAEES